MIRVIQFGFEKREIKVNECALKSIVNMNLNIIYRLTPNFEIPFIE